MEKINMGWGNPYFLLELLENMYCFTPSNLTPITSMVYEEDDGNAELLKYCKQITEKTSGNTYKYYYITNGATQAINSIMRVWAREKQLLYCVTSKTGYPYYPMMINNNALLAHKRVDLSSYSGNSADDMVIVDSPSNPLGEQLTGGPINNRFFPTNTVWDSVYHNKIYNACPIVKPAHDVYVNSFSKLLGLTGARVGWVATNNKNDYNSFMSDSLHENATVSKISQDLMVDILNNINLDKFMELGKNYLDQNREDISKISGILGTEVQNVGMFYSAEVDDKMFKLFDSANIEYKKFNIEEKQFIRLNIGQTHGIINQAVKNILKKDKIK